MVKPAPPSRKRDSSRDSVRDSVRDSPRDSVRDSPRDSVRDSPRTPSRAPSCALPPHKGPLIVGFHAVEAFLDRPETPLSAVFVAENRHDERMQACLSKAQQHGLNCQKVTSEALDEMAGAHRHQGIVAVLSERLPLVHLDDLLDDLRPDSLFLVLDGIQDPHNLGACLRVADAAGVSAVIAPKDRATGLTAAAVKVASGAASTVPYVVVTNLARTLRALKDAGVWVVGAAGVAEKTVHALEHTGPMAWVLGSEAEGLRRLTRDTCDELARIPMHGAVESLNVSVAAGICLFQTQRCRMQAAAPTTIG